MDWKKVEKNWQNMGTEFQQKFSKLSDEEIQRIGGDRQMLQKQLEEHYDLNEDEAEKRLDRFVKGLDDSPGMG